jgi:hypothetical protein
MVVFGARFRMAAMQSAKCRAAVFEIVAVDRRHHHMMQSQLRHRLRQILRLMRIERARHAGFDVAEGAGARAGIAHDHDGGMLLLQHSPIFGQAASSQTVLSFSLWMMSRVA